MEFNIDLWINEITDKLKNEFKTRLLFIGLQGSYNRGEAGSESDVDIVVIVDELNFEDLRTYKDIVNSMPFKEKACGFISGKPELEMWSKSDLFQFFNDTKPLFGSLYNITNPPDIGDIKSSIKSGSENLYHASVHSYVHSDNKIQDLINLFKMTFFILQAKYFVETNNYIKTKQELLNHLKGIDKDILNICINRKNIENKTSYEIEMLYKKLIKWCSDNICYL